MCFRYKYEAPNWIVLPESEILPKTKCLYQADLSPIVGRKLEGVEISFKDLKLVNIRNHPQPNDEYDTVRQIYILKTQHFVFNLFLNLCIKNTLVCQQFKYLLLVHP